MAEPKSYSISMRLRRVTVEEAFVSVPLNEEVLEPAVEGLAHRHVDGEKVVKVALELGRHPKTCWILEGQPVIEPHPIQMPPPSVQ